MISPELQKKFDANRSVEKTKERYEQLCEMGINHEFAHRLSEMFCEIHATAQEVMEVEEHIITADSNIKMREESSRMRKVSPLDEWRNIQASNDDNYLKKSV